MNTASLEKYYPTLKKKIAAMLHRQGTNPQDIDSIVNISIYKAWVKLQAQPDSTEQDLVKLSLYIASHRRIDQIRTNTIHAKQELQEHHHPSHTDKYFEQTVQEFIDYLSPLNDTHKKVMFMSYWCGYRNQQIADTLNMTNAAVRVTKTRSIKQLAETLKI